MRRPFRPLALVLAVTVIAACGGDQPTDPADGGDDGPAASPAKGAVSVSTFSSGSDADSDGFEGTVAGQSFSLQVSESVVIADLDTGSVSVGLGDVAPNCDIPGDNPRSVQVVQDDTTAVEFEMTCPFSMVGKMVYVAGNGPTKGLYTANPDGSNSFKLYDLSMDSYPEYYSDFTLSADGTELVFTMRDSSFDAHTYHEDFTDDQSPAKVSWIAPAPDFAPTGRRIAYTSQAQGSDGRIVVRDLATGSLRELTDDISIDEHPHWIDDTSILFDSYRGQTDTIVDKNLWRVNVENRSLTVVDTSNRDSPSADVAPDGSQLVTYLGSDPGSYDWRLHTHPMSGGSFSKATSDTADTQHFRPSYHSNGEWIYYVYNNPRGDDQIRRVRPDGSADELVREFTSTGLYDVLIGPQP